MAESCECCVISSHYVAIEKNQTTQLCLFVYKAGVRPKPDNEANLASTEFIAYLEVLLLDPICTRAHSVIMIITV